MAEYEFTTEQNEAIDSLREKILHVSVLMFVMGILLELQGHLFFEGTTLAYLSIGGAIYIVLGFVFFRPIDNLRRITTMEGEDIFQLMVAMDDLRIAFTVGTVVYIVGILALVAAMMTS